MQTTTLRPGLLVSLKSSVSGNVRYRRRDIDTAVTPDGEEQTSWETERTIKDKAEHDAAIRVRSKCRSLIGMTCSNSNFGLLCPETKIVEFNRAVLAAQALAAQFNATSRFTRLSVYVLTGRVSPDDGQAIRAINSEISDLLKTMEEGLATLDVAKVRQAADRARDVGQMLSDDASSKVKAAIAAARSAARRIVKAGEEGAQEIDRVAIRTIASSRTAFLDLDETGTVEAPGAIGRAVEFEPTAPAIAAAGVSARDIEL